MSDVWCLHCGIVKANDVNACGLLSLSISLNARWAGHFDLEATQNLEVRKQAVPW